MENQSSDYNLDFGLYSEPGAPAYHARVESCTKQLRESEVLKSNSIQNFKNIDGKSLVKKEALNYVKSMKGEKKISKFSYKT